MTIYSIVDVLEENIAMLLAITKMNTLYILINIIVVMFSFTFHYVIK